MHRCVLPLGGKQLPGALEHCLDSASGAKQRVRRTSTRGPQRTEGPVCQGRASCVPTTRHLATIVHRLYTTGQWGVGWVALLTHPVLTDSMILMPNLTHQDGRCPLRSAVCRDRLSRGLHSHR